MIIMMIVCMIMFVLGAAGLLWAWIADSTID